MQVMSTYEMNRAAYIDFLLSVKIPLETFPFKRSQNKRVKKRETNFICASIVGAVMTMCLIEQTVI